MLAEATYDLVSCDDSRHAAATQPLVLLPRPAVVLDIVFGVDDAMAIEEVARLLAVGAPAGRVRDHFWLFSTRLSNCDAAVVMECCHGRANSAQMPTTQRILTIHLAVPSDPPPPRACGTDLCLRWQ